MAIDLTLIDSDNEELDMGTEFESFHDFPIMDVWIFPKSYQNRLILLGIMTDAGWDFYRNEWWHYQLFNSKKFPLIDEI